MSKIKIESDCGNSPKKKFLGMFNAALCNRDLEFINNHILDNVIWEIPGSNRIIGKKAYFKNLEKTVIWEAREVFIDRIVTHGSDAAVSGQIISGENRPFIFCDLYQFSSAGSSQIKCIRSFITVV